MIELYILRHAQTKENEQGILQGQIDTELSEEGIKQAQQIAINFMNEKFDFIITSDLKRARETAYEISKYQPFAKFIVDPLIRERNFGEYNGLKMTEYAQMGYPEPKEGETVNQIITRAKKFYYNLKENFQNSKVLIVTHNGFYRALCVLLKNLEPTQIYSVEPLDNTAFTKILIKNSEIEFIKKKL